MVMSLDLTENKLQRRIAAQRALRLEKEEQEKQAALYSGSAQEFWDLVDSSDGADSCHMWRGRTDPTWTTYTVGKFELEGCTSTLTHRIAVLLTFGRLPEEDITPICDERLCCNVKHLAVKCAGNNLVPVQEFFCE
jgi:hypothetical protein